MTCKGICNRHHFVRGGNTGFYDTGAKRCQVCDIWLRWPTNFCPCCGYKLRVKPRWRARIRRIEAAKKMRGKTLVH